MFFLRLGNGYIITLIMNTSLQARTPNRRIIRQIIRVLALRKCAGLLRVARGRAELLTLRIIIEIQIHTAVCTYFNVI